jgi:cob(I)alamin adenosyltransferase
MSSIKVADEYRLKNRENGEYQKDQTKELTRKGMKVESSYIKEVNRNTASSGKMMVVDKGATEAFAASKIKHEEKIKDDRKKSAAGVTDELLSAINSKKDNSDLKTEESQDEDLVAKHFELFGKAPMKTMKNANLETKIETELARLKDIADADADEGAGSEGSGITE